jgi:hypothetical protein
MRRHESSGGPGTPASGGDEAPLSEDVSGARVFAGTGAGRCRRARAAAYAAAAVMRACPAPRTSPRPVVPLRRRRAKARAQYGRKVHLGACLDCLSSVRARPCARIPNRRSWRVHADRSVHVSAHRGCAPDRRAGRRHRVGRVGRCVGPGGLLHGLSARGRRPADQGLMAFDRPRYGRLRPWSERRRHAMLTS